jgi:hypothetical protein
LRIFEKLGENSAVDNGDGRGGHGGPPLQLSLIKQHPWRR